MTAPDPRLTGETVELLQALIRNACVNDGTTASGQEVRNADLLDDALDGLPRQHFEPLPGRRSILATVEGRDPDAPSILLMGHTDVVPVTPDEWRHDPFGGELIDDEVWGRGAVDMLNLTASMAVAIRELHRRPEPPAGTVRFLGVADEEAGGVWGADWITQHAWDQVACDYVLTESGGIPFDTPDGRKLVMATAEKGIGWRKLIVHGTPSHGSMPFGTDNALVTASEVVRRLAAYLPTARLDDRWRAWVRTLPIDDDLRKRLLDPDTIGAALGDLDPTLARYCHAVTHTTFSPNVVAGGNKTNIIPDRVELEVDIRTVPGVAEHDVEAMLAEAIGPDLLHKVDVESLTTTRPASASSADTPMFELLRRRAEAAHPGAEVMPWTIVGGTDAAFFRDRGVPAYGAGLYSGAITLPEFASRFHGHDERIDVASLGLSTQLWLDLADGLTDVS